MGKARRCRAVVIGASVAALGAMSACSTASAVNSESPGSHGPVEGAASGRATVARKHGRHRAHHAEPFVYKLTVSLTSSEETPSCVGQNAVFRALLRPASNNAEHLFLPREWEEKEGEVSANTSTRLRLFGESTLKVHSICDLGSHKNWRASPGIFTWRLPFPARHLGEVLSYPVSEAEISVEAE